MRLASAELRDVLTGSSDVTFEADYFYGDVRVAANVPLEDVSVDWSGSAKVEGSGSATVVWSDDAGVSLSPFRVDDYLAPFGSRLVVFCRVSVGAFSERLQVGVFTVTDVPGADDYTVLFGGSRVTVGSRVQVQFMDRLVEVQRDRFTRLASPSQLVSVYAELADLTGFQLTRTVPDAAITRSVPYEEDRLKALADVAAIVGGTPFMESDGTLSVRPVVPGAPVAALSVGEQGTIETTGSVLSSDGIYNGIIIRGETDSQTAVLAELWITEGPLRATVPGGPRTPFHRVPKFYSSPFITTQAQAQAAAPGLLAQLATPGASSLRITCLVDPRLQLGDVVTVDDGLAVWTVRLSKVSLKLGAYMTVEGDVLSRTPYTVSAPVISLSLLGYGEGGYGEGGYGL